MSVIDLCSSDDDDDPSPRKSASDNNASYTRRPRNGTERTHVNGERRSPYHNNAPQEASLAALLAGVADNDHARLEQLRSSMGKRGFGSPQAEQQRDDRSNKFQRDQERWASQGVVSHNAIHKAQPRKSDGNGIVKRPVQRSSAATPTHDGNASSPFSRLAVPAIAILEPRRQENLAPQAVSSKEHTYSGAGLSITKATAESRGTLSAGQNYKRPAGSAATHQASESAAKRRRIDHGVTMPRESVLSPDVVAKRGPSFVDVTDPTSERVSYSDEPEPPAPKPLRANVTSILHPEADVARPAQTASRSSLDKELEAQVSMEAIRSKASRPDTKVSTNRNTASKGSPANPVTVATAKRNAYSNEDRQLMQRLKEVDRLSWDEIITYFPGRTLGSIQVHYSTKVKGQRVDPAENVPDRPQRAVKPVVKPTLPKQTARDPSSDRAAPVRARRARGAGGSAVDGIIRNPWTARRNGAREVTEEEAETSGEDDFDAHFNHLVKQDRVHPNSASRLLRLRELGLAGTRAWGQSARYVSEELKNHVMKGHGIQQQYHGTSGDVVALSWSANDDRFVAGSIAISDATSMQYNMSRNLLVGDAKAGDLRELVDHHISRPSVDDEKNVNGLHAMRESQDPRLFLTVTAAGFSPSGDKLYTAGTDKQLRMYATDKELSGVKCEYTIPHTATVDLLSVHVKSAVATGCHSALSSINVYSCSERDYSHCMAFSPSRSNLEVSVPIYPSALKWGRAHHHSNYLLAGFSGDEERAHAGETCLWDVTTGQSVDLRTATRNVFDVAWNPCPSPASVAFAVAALSTGTTVSKGTRSVVHLFAPRQHYARRVQTLECAAHDLNDVIFCAHDDNLVATGSADGMVYVWDQRASVDTPLHTLAHGKSVLVEESPDTGVRFLSWGATASRLYSGSSDGIVKVWNPYRSQDNAHIDDIAAPKHQRSAVMSGAFSSDYRELLVGTENGRIDLFSIGGHTKAKPKQFKLQTAPAPKQELREPFEAARSLLDDGQIEFRPCGAMPFRQAVQGPKYRGPFLAPSTQETMQAEAAYQDALTAQHEASAKRTAQAIYLDDDKDMLEDSKKVQEAQRTIEDLQERLQHFTFAQPKAEQFQRSLLKAEKARTALQVASRDTTPCHLDCNFLPGADEQEDSLRSELRIPGMQRSIELNAVLTKDEEADDACAMCFPKNPLIRDGVRTYCSSCSLKRANLTTTCSQCSAPARVETDKTKKTLCERCSFACFRCGRTAEFDTDADGMNVVTCVSCALAWEADVLGYKLVPSGRGPLRRRSSAESLPDRIGRDWDGFADGEREHYASLWEESPRDEWS